MRGRVKELFPVNGEECHRALTATLHPHWLGRRYPAAASSGQGVTGLSFLLARTYMASQLRRQACWQFNFPTTSSSASRLSPSQPDAVRNPDLQEAIIEYLGDLEDFYLAEQRLADIRAGRAGTVPMAEVERDLGLAN